MKLPAILFGSFCILCGHAFLARGEDAPSGGQAPLAIPTFHCLGLYWSPPGGAPDRKVLVRYRRQGASEWKEGLPMRYNPIPRTDEDLADYRGSIVHLAPATTYEIQFTLESTSTTANLTAATWSEDFPAGETFRVGDSDTPLSITDSGTPDAWRAYNGRGATIDVRHQRGRPPMQFGVRATRP